MCILASKKNKTESARRKKSGEGKQQAVICGDVQVVGGVSLT